MTSHLTRLSGFHGRTDGRDPTKLPVLYLGDLGYAEAWADDGETVWRVTALVESLLDIDTATAFADVWDATHGPSPCGHPVFHAPYPEPSCTAAFVDGVRALGHDAVRLRPSAFDTDDQDLWELICGTFGDPQIILLDPNPDTTTALARCTMPCCTCRRCGHNRMEHLDLTSCSACGCKCRFASDLHLPD